MEKADVEKLQQSIDLIAKTTAHILDNMATKQDIADLRKDLNLTEFRLQTQISGIETDLKSFKEEVRNR